MYEDSIINESTEDTVKKIRIELSKAFPLCDFRIRIEQGEAVIVTWTDGPLYSDVLDITEPFSCLLRWYYEYEGQKYRGARRVTQQREKYVNVAEPQN